MIDKQGAARRPAAVARLVLVCAVTWLASLAQAQTNSSAVARPAAPAAKQPARVAARPATAASAVAPAVAQAGFSVAPPPAWVQATPAEAIPAELPRAPVQVALIERQTRVEDDARTNQYFVRGVRQINEPSGLEAASRVEVEFDPSYQRLVLHTVQVLRAGQRIDKLDARQVKLLHREPQLERQMIDGRMTAALVLDDVRVGDRIDWSYSLIGDNPVFAGRFVAWDWTLSSLGPTAHYRHRLLVPAARNVRHQTADPGVTVSSTLQGAMRETVFTRRLAPQFHFDPVAPGSIYLKDQIQLSEFADWADVARWAEQLFADAAHAGPELRAVAERLRAEPGTPAERLRRALDLVQTEVRYFGTEIGSNSHRPAAAEQVWRQRFGDCKDKVALLMALSRELGLSAQPLLVSTRYTSAAGGLLPSPLVFDHAIAGVELNGRLLWLDGTRSQQTGPAAERQPLGLGWGLPARAGVQALVALPSGADSVRVEAEQRLRFPNGLAGEARLESRHTFHGDLAEWLRSARAAQPPAEFAQQLAADLMRSYPGLSADGEPQLNDLPDRNAVTVSQAFRLRNPFRFPAQRQLQMDFALPALMSPLRLPDQNPRTQPLRLAYPGIYRESLAIEFFEPVYAKPASQRAEERNAQFELEVRYEATADVQRVSGELRLPNDRIEAADWSRYRDNLVKVWPRLSNTLSVSALTIAQMEGLRSRFDALETQARRGQLKLVTTAQRDAHGRLLLLSEQLASGRLAPALRAEALVARGEQLDHLGRLDDAKADFLQALQLSPQSAEVLGAMAVNAFLRGADDEAVRHAGAALAQSPADMGPRYTRVFAQYFRGDWRAARDEALQIVAQRGEVERSYAPIWLYLAERRAGGDGVAATASYQPTSSRPAWPHAVLQYLRGTGSFDAAMAATREDGKPDAGRLCELYFYAGEKALLDGDKRTARQHWQKSVDTGVIEFNEYSMAKRALEASDGR